MKELNFIQLQKDNGKHFDLFESLMIPYNIELDSHQHRETPKEFINKITHSILNMQGVFDRHLEFCYDGDTLIGFLYGKVDHEGHKGFIKPEYGYIMEFYVKPEFRRMGFGKAMFQRLERLFASHGTKRMYLTADPVTGKPFWEALGFICTKEISPENGLMIYEKDIPHPNENNSLSLKSQASAKVIQERDEPLGISPISGTPSLETTCSLYRIVPATIFDASHIAFLYEKNANALHGKAIKPEEWKRALSEEDPDEKYFLIYTGTEPCAWLKINGLLNQDLPWLSMLVVNPLLHRQGIGTYAIKFAEEYIKKFGFTKIGIRTTEDNIPAQRLYQKCGYSFTTYENELSIDGVSYQQYTFIKML